MSLRPIAQNIEVTGRATSFLRYGIALASARGEAKMAAKVFADRWPRSMDAERVQRICKAAVPAGSTTDSTWAAPLAEQQPLASAFVELLRSRTVLGQMMGSMRPVPFNVKFPRQTGGVSARWVGQRQVVPVSSQAFETLTFGISKIATLLVMSQELINNADPSAEAIVRADMTEAIAAYMDVQFLDPSIAAVADISPASITNGATEITASASTADDLRRLFAAVTTRMSAPYLIMRPGTAIGWRQWTRQGISESRGNRREIWGANGADIRQRPGRYKQPERKHHHPDRRSRDHGRGRWHHVRCQP